MNESLAIRPVKTPSDLKTFLRFPWQLYKQDPNWSPPLYFDRQALLDREKHPFFEFAEAEYFIAWRGDQPVGTIAAFVNHRHNEFHEENVAHFGFYEVMRDTEAAIGLLQTACDWGKQQGKDKLLGPANFSSNHTYGLLVDGFDRPPVIEMTYNPAYYVDYIESAGFEKAMDLWAWYFSIPEIFGPHGEKMPPKLVRVVEKIRKRYNVKIREINMKDWDNEILRFSQVYQAAWSKNWGFVPLTDEELKHLAESLKIVVDPRITLFAEIDGKMVGASVPLPDINEILVRVRPGPSTLSSYLAAIPLLLGRRKVKMLRIFAMGVVEEYRGRGIDALFYYETVKRALQVGYQEGEASWILENNDMMNRAIKMLGGEVYKTYRIYQKSLV
ncbi:MAG: GNAT family N-acetyltransferase [Anaerolineales bacterium]|nr:GNAT family N-acetyltransferase [Anaerolineales bacterium]